MMEDLVLNSVLGPAVDVVGGSGEVCGLAAVSVGELLIEALNKPWGAAVLDRPCEADTDRLLGEF